MQYRAEYKAEPDDHGRMIQTLYFVDDDNNHTRGAYWDSDQAFVQLTQNFRFNEHRTYVISYLTNYGWRSGAKFNYSARRINLANYVYNHETELEEYDHQALDFNDFKIFGIEVRQI